MAKVMGLNHLTLKAKELKRDILIEEFSWKKYKEY